MGACAPSLRLQALFVGALVIQGEVLWGAGLDVVDLAGLGRGLGSPVASRYCSRSFVVTHMWEGRRRLRWAGR